MANQPAEKPGPHHPHQGHVPGDLDPQGHRDKSAPPTGTTGPAPIIRTRATQTRELWVTRTPRYVGRTTEEVSCLRST